MSGEMGDPVEGTGRSRTLGVGILGYGFMGRTHTYAHLTMPLYYEPPPLQCQLRSVCVRRRESGEAALQAGFQRWTTDPQELIAAEDVDIVHICTPNHLHFAALKAAIRAGKHIYCDKPVTASIAEADELAQLLPDHRGKGQVALQYRFLPATLRAKQLAESGFLGPITHFRGAYLHSGSVDPDKAVNWKSMAAAGGGVIRDLGAHVIDLIWWLIGPFQEVNCVGRIWAPQRPDMDHPGMTVAIDAEEAAAMMLRREDGAFGVVEVSKIATGTEDELRFELHGGDGAMRFNLMQPNYLEICDARRPDGEYGGERGWQRIACVQRYPKPGGLFPGPKFSVGWIRSHVHCLYSFLRAIAEDAQPTPSLAEGLHLQRVLEAARASAQRGDWVELPQAG